jgi:hypothetical protein
MSFVIHNGRIHNGRSSITERTHLHSIASLVISAGDFRGSTKIDIIRILHIVAVSFVCREAIMRHKILAKQKKEVQQEDGMPIELETVAGSVKCGRGGQN